MKLLTMSLVLGLYSFASSSVAITAKSNIGADILLHRSNGAPLRARQAITDCPDFSGHWTGKCRLQDGTAMDDETLIRQTKCEWLNMGNSDVHFGNFVSETATTPWHNGAGTSTVDWDEAGKAILINTVESVRALDSPRFGVVYTHLKLWFEGEDLKIESSRAEFSNDNGEVKDRRSVQTCQFAKQPTP